MSTDQQVLEQVTAIRVKIDKALESIAARRDELRDYVNEIQSIIDDADEAEDLIKDARDSLDNAADALSKYL